MCPCTACKTETVLISTGRERDCPVTKCVCITRDSILGTNNASTLFFAYLSSLTHPSLDYTFVGQHISLTMTLITLSSNKMFAQYVLLCMAFSREYAHTNTHWVSHEAAAAAWRRGAGIASSVASVNWLIRPLHCSCSCWLILYITSEGETKDGTER